MIKIYLSGSCSSCRKAKKWLRKRHIEFEEINLSKDYTKELEKLKSLDDTLKRKEYYSFIKFLISFPHTTNSFSICRDLFVS